MSIRKKTIITILATTFLLITVIYLGSRVIFLRSFIKLEEKKLGENVERVIHAIEDEISGMENIADDWACWDDTYRFIKDRNEEYIKSNLVDETFPTLKLNLIVYVDKNYNIVFSKAYDLIRNRSTSMPRGFMDHIKRGLPLVEKPIKGKDISGIITLPDGPLLIVSKPILTSEEKGPSRGALIMARFLDEREVEDLSRKLRLSISIKRAKRSQEGIIIRPVSSRVIEGSTILKDIYGKPAILLTVSMRRDIYEMGVATTFYVAICLLILGAIFTLVVIFLLEKQVLSRLSFISEKVEEIGKKRDFSRRLEIPGKDELSKLGSSINNMLKELEEAKEELKRERDRERNYLDIVEVIIIALDQNGIITMVNGKGCRVMGFSCSDLLGRSWFDFIPDPYREDVKDVFKRVLNGERVEHYECPILTKSGEERVIAWNMIPLRDGVLSSGEDITERKRFEELRNRLITAIEHAAETIMITDKDGNIQYVNPAFEKITGYSREEVIGKNPRILKSGKHDKKFYENLWNTIKNGKVWRGRFVNRKKDGSLYEEEATISPVFDEPGVIAGYVAVKRDITQEVALEEQLRQAQKMEAMGELAAGIAHDFNNLLTAIAGYTELLEMRIKPEDPLRKNVDQIKRATERAASLIRQLLAFSKRQVLQPQILDLNKVVRSVEILLRRIIGKDIEFVMDLRDDLFKIKADFSQMEQVVMNLILNAKDAMPHGGRITLKTDNVILEDVNSHIDARPGRFVKLVVSDTGVGMDKETLERIFDPFFTTKGIGKGSGLGLSVVYGIVKQHGGWIDVESEPGKGSKFTIYLPAIE